MKYSIITINYNNCDGLRRTIESVVNQTCQDFEYIVIDGGSTDGSVEVIKEYADRIDYWVSEPDKGIYNAMNKGILQAHGEYLNFMNSGDCFYDDIVLFEVLKSLGTDYDIIIGKAVVNGNPKIVFTPKSPMTLFNLCIYGFNHQATFYRRKLFENNMYDESLKLLADWKFTIQCLVLNQCLYKYIDNFIALYDLSGISSIDREGVQKEKEDILNTIFPRCIAEDYIFFSKLKSPLLYEIPKIAKTNRIHKFVIKLIQVLLRFHRNI